MKRVLLVLVAMMLFFSACSYIQKEAIPEGLYTAPQMKADQLQRGDHVILTRYGFRLFTIPISLPQPNTMINTAIQDNQGKGITNLDVEFSEFNILIFQIPKIRIEGDIVK
ncbi:MAG TPA: hypothetical protein PK961_08485 [bacterium]|nr:hypothetical protein [bacterium]